MPTGQNGGSEFSHTYPSVAIAGDGKSLRS